MNAEAQRIAIAEACGFASITLEQLPTHAALRGMIDGRWKWLPDYLSDINAMHEAVDSLNPIQREDFAGSLCRIICGPEVEYHQMHLCELVRFANATAAQRAEAFLRTVGRWTE